MPAPPTDRTAAELSVTELSVADLVTAAQAGDPRAWEEIVARFGGLVRTVVGSFRLQDADTADAVQNTWLRALERLHTVREPERFGGWLRTTARRECLALPAVTGREVPEEALTDRLVETAPGPEAAVLDGEAGRAVRDAVDGLSGRRRRLVDALFYAESGDYAVVSRLTDMPVGSIGPTRARVLGVLRTTLERTGFGPDADPPAPAAVPAVPVPARRASARPRPARPHPVPLRPRPAAPAERRLPLAAG
jgi:RNA polymerase sigma factor (sigma-70 family)